MDHPCRFEVVDGVRLTSTRCTHLILILTHRAAVAPYLAAHVINTTTGSMPEWILYGDDDTLWVRQGLERVLKEEGMLPTQELLLSDALWFTDFQHSAAGIHSDEEDDGNAGGEGG